jgi:hypothetical protein
MLEHIEFIYVSFFLTIGTFILAFVLGWFSNNLFDAWYQNASYAKHIIHPEMLDEDGRILQDELTYLTFSDDDDIFDEEDE